MNYKGYTDYVDRENARLRVDLATATDLVRRLVAAHEWVGERQVLIAQALEDARRWLGWRDGTRDE